MATNTAKKKSGETSRKRVVVLSKREKSEESAPAEAGLLREGGSFLLLMLALSLSLALFSQFHAPAQNIMGLVGSSVASKLIGALGWCSWVVVVWAGLLAHTVWHGEFPNSSTTRQTVLSTVFGSVVMAFSSATVFSVLFEPTSGGAIGAKLSARLIPWVNHTGTVLFCFAAFVLSLGAATGFHTSSLLELGRRSRGPLQKGVHGTLWLSSLIARAQLALTRLCLVALGRGVRNTVQASATLMRRDDREERPRREPLFEFKREAKTLPPAPVPVLLEHKPVLENELVVTPRIQESRLAPPPVEEEPIRHEEPLKILRGTIKPEEEEAEEDESEETFTNKLKSRFSRKKGSKAKRDEVEESEDEEEEEEVEAEHDEPLPQFELPELELLVRSEGNLLLTPQDDELIANCKQLEKTLLDFKIGGKIVEVQPGPVITLYQFEPAPGIKVQRIITLADDLALSLKVASVRVYAPVPGKGTVGIEVPNQEREIVRLREVLDSSPWRSSDSTLSLALGKDTFGEPYVADLAKMPHLLIAGATGTGKSVCINSLLLSLLFRNSPKDLRLILIDPKVLELSVYEAIPHLLSPVVTHPKRARGVLWWAVEEMERRYRAMKELGVRSLDSYNKLVGGGELSGGEGPLRPREDSVIELKEQDIVATSGLELDRGQVDEVMVRPLRRRIPNGHEHLPRIVIVVDELADLMLTVGREIEELLTRLAQKARAAGIHLILATQRPSVNVITGLIKANFPARISFKVASRIDARTVLDMSGAEKLLGQGDMLFLPPGTSKVKRVHSAFVSDNEVHDVVRWLHRQGEPDYNPEIEAMIERIEEAESAAEGGGSGGGEEEYDPLYDQAVNLVIEKGSASTSMVQRVFRIGYNRAARILEVMEREGVIGPADGAKPRTVLGGGRGTM